MGIPVFKERRLSNRKKLTGLLPGRILDPCNKNINCKPVDVSSHGLGFISDTEINAGSRLKLVMKDREIELLVTWGQPDFGKRDKFRYGTVVIDRSIDLEKVFTETGCLV